MSGRRGRGMGGRRARRALVVLGAAAALVVLGASLARGEQQQQGNLIVSLDGGISPLALPRHDPAPVSLRLSGSVRTADRTPLPQLLEVELALPRRGLLSTRGLPVCDPGELKAAEPPVALAVCGRALVGSGRLDVEVVFPGQDPFTFHGTLRAFNGRFGKGRRAVWLHVHGADPPSSFVLPFVLHHRGGGFGPTMVAKVPPGLGPWPHLARFEMTLSRRFPYRGRSRSYLNASCPLPPSFTAGFFPLARATYTFAGGRRIGTMIVRGCRARSDTLILAR